ncbi:transcription-repair coupling factor [Eisenibacter elegans]|uniref:transcription-repair coupling factor n=1 Tax=Eisenibacter elegans TaxID=997 RepID=UPI00041A46F1|nr:transcription-repair coupling factor [Eisenibacter elegans]
MKRTDFLLHYQQDTLLQTLAAQIHQPQPAKIHLKGLVGSLDALVAAALYRQHQATHLFIMHDKEEAAYFAGDLQNLLGSDEVVQIFPTSYKRPYQYEEIENANVLQRAEVLNRINQSAEGLLVVTYPEALSERVINRKSLLQHTFSLSQGEKIDLQFLTEILASYDFERTDFVTEPGQYAVRGGIVDVFSFANDWPYRVDFFGNEVESLRIFDPVTQLSTQTLDKIAIIPNVQTKLIEEQRESFFEFIPKQTKVWYKDRTHLLDTLAQSFQKVEESFMQIMDASNNTQVVSSPETLFLTRTEAETQLKRFTTVAFGKRFNTKADYTFEYQASPQPSFNKNFELLADNLLDNQTKQYQNFIATDSAKQTERLQTIFDEINPQVQFQSLHCGLREGFIDHQVQWVCYTDHQIFERYYRYRQKERYSKSKAITIKELKALKPGDFVTHIDYGIGRFAGMEMQEINGRPQEVIRLVYRDDDLLYVNIHSLHKITKYSGKEGSSPVISKLGSGEWENKKRKVKKHVQDIAKDLIALYAKRKAAPGFAFSQDSFLQAELESSFLYEDTPDQAKTTADVKQDMEQPYPMDRLVCGDVGFGKTEIAIRAAFKAVCDNKQVAVLVPTTVLAMQHYRTFTERLKTLPCKVEYINRFRSAAQIRETLKRVAEGETQILIGTHRIANKDVKFKDLGLLIIDEEQKFGVKTKEKIKEMRIHIDVLTLTATPIPRTLQFSLLGARDLSIIATPPPNRQPVTTEVHTFSEELVRDAISYEIRRGGQVYFVHNRVADIDSIANLILRLVPEARIGVVHGQMEGATIEKRMMRFIEGDYDVLVSTNIIESGLDIPNANTILINSAHTFGLSDLHQMRGRVGRSNRKAFCYLITPPSATLAADSRKRLGALEEFSDLGDGFKISMRDLDIRGAGNLLGAEQSGFISDVGFEMYHKILDEALQELKETDFRELFMHELQAAKNGLSTNHRDCNIETDLSLLIPDEYVKNISERLSLYNQLDNIQDESSLQAFKKGLIDRFGNPPSEVADLIDTVRLRWLAAHIGFEKLTLKNQTIRGYFVDKDTYFTSDRFGKVIRFVQANPKRVRLKEVNQKPMLIIPEIQTIQEARDILSDIQATL